MTTVIDPTGRPPTDPVKDEAVTAVEHGSAGA